MLSVIMLLLSADPFAPARADITRYCEGRSACVATQRRQLGHFVSMMASFKDPQNRNAAHCMRSGKSGKFINWQIAADCMRKRVKGRGIGR